MLYDSGHPPAQEQESSHEVSIRYALGTAGHPMI